MEPVSRCVSFIIRKTTPGYTVYSQWTMIYKSVSTPLDSEFSLLKLIIIIIINLK